MPDSLARHPDEPAGFDFFSWRVRRRLVGHALITLDNLDVADTDAVGHAFLHEAVTDVEDEAVRSLLLDYDLPDPLDTRDVYLGVMDLLIQHGTGLPIHASFPPIVVDWEGAAESGEFAGLVDGERIRATLSPFDGPIPAREVVYLGADGEAREPQAVDQPVGTHPRLTPFVWDWLLARRLTLREVAGELDWPVEFGEAGPIVAPWA